MQIVLHFRSQTSFVVVCFIWTFIFWEYDIKCVSIVEGVDSICNRGKGVSTGKFDTQPCACWLSQQYNAQLMKVNNDHVNLYLNHWDLYASGIHLSWVKSVRIKCLPCPQKTVRLQYNCYHFGTFLPILSKQIFTNSEYVVTRLSSIHGLWF